MSNLRVLIVEDDMSLSSMLSSCFTANECQPETARSLKRAREIANGHGLVLLDAQLGDGGGGELLTCFNAPVVLMSAHGPAELRERYDIDVHNLPGQSYYVRKPFRLKGFLHDCFLAVRVRAIHERIVDGSCSRQEALDFLGEVGDNEMLAPDLRLIRRLVDAPRTHTNRGAWLTHVLAGENIVADIRARLGRAT